MNSPQRHDPWPQLTAAARQVPVEPDASAPYGFATRVTAQASASQRAEGSLLEIFALRALGIASAIAVCTFVLNYPEIAAVRPAGSESTGYLESELISHDANLALVLDLSE